MGKNLSGTVRKRKFILAGVAGNDRSMQFGARFWIGRELSSDIRSVRFITAAGSVVICSRGGLIGREFLYVSHPIKRPFWPEVRIIRSCILVVFALVVCDGEVKRRTDRRCVENRSIHNIQAYE